MISSMMAFIMNPSATSATPCRCISAKSFLPAPSMKCHCIQHHSNLLVADDSLAPAAFRFLNRQSRKFSREFENCSRRAGLNRDFQHRPEANLIWSRPLKKIQRLLLAHLRHTVSHDPRPSFRCRIDQTNRLLSIRSSRLSYSSK